MAAHEFGAVVEGDRVSPLLIQFFHTLFDLFMHMVGVLGLNLDDDRKPRLAIDQRRQAARAWRAQHGVALEIAQPQPLFDHFRAIVDTGGIPRRAGVFPPVWTLPAMPQKRFPVLAVLVLLDPGVDRLRRNSSVGILLLHPSRDLFRRPFPRQSRTDSLVDVGIFHLAHQGTLLPPPLGLLLGLCGKVFAVHAVASQLAADRGRRTPNGLRDFLLIGSLIPQLCYTITLFHCKMMCHRWDSIPKEKFARLSPIGTSQRCFFLHQLSRLICRASIAFEF